MVAAFERRQPHRGNDRLKELEELLQVLTHDLPAIAYFTNAEFCIRTGKTYCGGARVERVSSKRSPLRLRRNNSGALVEVEAHVRDVRQ